MGGFIGLLNQQAAQQQPQAATQPAGQTTPGQPAPPAMLGQQGQDQQQPQQQPSPDQISQGLDTASQFYQQQLQENAPKPMTGGPVRNLLQRFFSGMGDSMMQQAGLPTPYQKTQAAIAGIQNVAGAKGMLALHQMEAERQSMMAQNMMRQPAPPELAQYGITPGTMMTPAEQVQAMVKHGQETMALQGTLGAADIGIHKPITVPGIGGFNWDDKQGKYIPVQGGQIPQHQLLPGEAKQLGFPEGTTQLPENIWAQAAKQQMAQGGKTASTVEYKQIEDGSIVALPKTTVTRPNIPGLPGGSSPRTGGGLTPQTVPGPNGEPLMGQRSGQSRSRADAASAIQPLLARANEMLQDPEVANNLGPLAGRWDQIQQKVGNLPPKLRELAGTLTSIYSLAGTMHGWRALQVADEFRKTYGGLEATPESLKGGLTAMKATADAVYGAGYGKPKAPPSNPNTDPFAAFGGRKR